MRLFGFLFGFYLLGSGMTTAFAAAIDKTLVVVNEEAITLSEYKARYRQEALQNPEKLAPFDDRIDPSILDRLIDDRIQAQTAVRRGIRVSRSDVERAVSFIAGQNDITTPQLLNQLSADGITPAQFLAGVEEQQLIRRLMEQVVGRRVTVSDQEVTNYLASHRDLIASDEAYEISHLFIALAGKSEAETQSELENLAHIRATIEEGRSFAASVSEFSDGPKRDEKGYLGWRKINQLPELFVDALRETEVDGVTQILRSGNGLHLLKVRDRRASGQMVEQQLVRHILIRPNAGLDSDAARKLVDELRARIIAGEDFATIARAHSADQASGLNGGLLGWVNPGDFPAEFELAMSRLELNELSPPLRAGPGYHLVEVRDRRRADLSLETAAKRARQVLFQRKAEAFYDNWYGTIRAAAHIEYIWENPG